MPKGALWDLLTYILLQNIKKLDGGLFWDIKKFFEKNSHNAEKSKGPFRLVRFCRLLLKK